MASKQERRQRFRIPLKKNIRHSLYQVLGTPVFQENSSLDLSGGGISFETTQAYKLGTLILLELEIKNEPIKLLICVAWVKKSPTQEGCFQIGGELVAIDPEHKRKMQSHLTQMIRELEAQNQAAKKKPAKKNTQKKAIKKRVTKKKPTKKKSSKKKR